MPVPVRLPRRRWSLAVALGGVVLVAPLAVAAPAVASATADEVVYVQENTATGASAVFLRRLGNPVATPVLPASPTSQDAGPRLSPEGTRIVVSTDRLSPDGGLAVVGRDGTGLRALTTNTTSVLDVDPCWADSGTVVFARQTFTTDGTGVQLLQSSRIFSVSADGGAPAPVGPAGGGGYSGTAPDVAADGSLVFVGVGPGIDGTLRTGTVAGAPAQALGVSGVTPSLSRDGTEVAYATALPSGVLHVVPVAGPPSADRTLDVSEGSPGVSAFAPRWLPDGESLAYERATSTSSAVYTTDRFGKRTGPLFAPATDAVLRFDGAVQGPAPTDVTGSTTAASFVPLTPARVFDSRAGRPPLSSAKGRVPAGGSITFTPPGLPPTATAVVLNVTGVDPDAGTFLTAYPAGTPAPSTSSVNLPAHTNVPNGVTVKLGPGGAVSVRNDAGTTDVVVDVSGYYTTGTGAGFAPVPGFRAYDSRPGHTPTSVAKGRLGAGGTVDVLVTGSHGVPADATAVVVNLTGIAASQTTLLRAYATPSDATAPPAVSTVNLAPGTNTANLAVVPVGDGGRVRVRNENGTVDLAMDVTGYYSPSAPGRFVAVDPLRLLDTRSGTGAAALPLGPAQVVDLRLDGHAVVAPTAVVANLTGVAPDQDTLLRTYSTDTSTPPTISSVNLTAGSVRANGVVLLPGADGRARIRNDLGRVGVVADLEGYFTTPAG